MRALHLVAFTLLVVGGLNWLAYGIFQTDIGWLFGGMDTVASRVVYILVGLAALYELYAHMVGEKRVAMPEDRPMDQPMMG
jgi:hypothetical protein